jgi:hypothetical protein
VAAKQRTYDLLTHSAPAVGNDVVMAHLAARQYPEPAHDHPVRRFGRIALDVDVEITSGELGEYDTIHSWTARARISDIVDVAADDQAEASAPGGNNFADPRVLAVMQIHSLDLWGHSIVDSADADSSELHALVAAAFTFDNDPHDALEQAMVASSGYQGWTPERVMTIDTFEVTPRWRGTAFTPYVAALMLSKFATLGRDAFILHAHPMMYGEADRLPATAWQTAQKKIIAMYRTIGFCPFDDDARMAGWFPDGALRAFMERAEHTWPYLQPDLDARFT